MNANVIIFDLDGTLIDTLSAIAYAFNKVLKSYNYKLYEVKEYRNFIGNSFIGVYEKIKDDQNIQVDREIFLEQVRKVYDENYLKETRMYDGIDKVLDYFTNKNKTMVILTNKDQKAAEKHVEQILSKWSFKAIYGNSDKYPRKPHPYVINKLIEEGYKKEDMCLIGDMYVDKNTAKNAGIRFILCKYGYENKEISNDVEVNIPIEITEYMK